MAIATRKKLINTQMSHQSKSNQYDDVWYIKDRVILTMRANVEEYIDKSILLVNVNLNSTITHRILEIPWKIYTNLYNDSRKTRLTQ